ncbi:MAG TPA: trypsin-like peptidase domain-containing protein [Polyangiaceae bacterium]|nr:trypsin-like peptidase domain-containing protein [Polyangiaceae bacterium]
MIRPDSRASATAARGLYLCWIAALAWLAVLLSAGRAAARDPSDEEVRSAVVRVEVSRAGHDWAAPWKLLPPESASGTAFLIDGARLLTNAHVVRDAQQVTVKRNDGSAPAIATVEAVDDDCDLALLRVANSSFLRGLRPLHVGDLPQVGSNVVTYGYPLGGLEMSTTAGVVSRIEQRAYLEGLSKHLVVQTDAALNPGNSGGPVVQRGLVVGVAFQVMSGAQSIGFFIPAPVVRHFLDDFTDGHYTGFPDMPIRVLPLSSPAYRRERRLPDERSGVVVQEIAAGSDLGAALEPGDVLMAVDGKRVADDGTCQVGVARVPFFHLVDMKSLGQRVRFEVWRDGKAMSAEWKASQFPPWDRLRRSRFKPRYLVYAGLLFVPATLEYFSATHPLGARRAAILHELAFRSWEPPPAIDRETVLLAHVFSNPANAGVDPTVPFVVERLNGQSVRNLADLARLLEESHQKQDVFELGPFHHVEAIDREQALSARATILSTYGISNDKSL